MSGKKSSTKCLSALKQLRRTFRHIGYIPPIDRLVLSLLVDSANIADKEALAARKRMDEFFVNWNEMRVGRRAEIARVLDPLEKSDQQAVRVRDMLNRLFDVCGSISLAPIEIMKPAEARRTLVDLDPALSRAVIALVLFELVPGTTLPLSPEGLKEAKKLDLVGRSGNKQQLQKLLQDELSQTEATELVQYLELPGLAKLTTTSTSKKKTAKKANKPKPKAKPATKKKAAKPAPKKAAKKVAKKKVAKKAVKKTAKKSAKKKTKKSGKK